MECDTLDTFCNDFMLRDWVEPLKRQWRDRDLFKGTPCGEMRPGFVDKTN